MFYARQVDTLDMSDIDPVVIAVVVVAVAVAIVVTVVVVVIGVVVIVILAVCYTLISKLMATSLLLL